MSTTSFVKDFCSLRVESPFQSRAFGVAHRRATAQLFTGRGHRRTASLKFGRSLPTLPLPPPRFVCVLKLASGVGQFNPPSSSVQTCEEVEALSPVRRADFSRRECSCRNDVAHLLKVSDDISETNGQMAVHVFAEDESWLDLSDDSCDVRPEMSWVSGSEPLACGAEGLTRISRSEAIHNSTPRSAVEGAYIRPNRCFIQDFLFQASRQDFATVGFPLNEADCSSMRDRSFNTKFESPDTGAQGQNVEGTCIHTCH